MDMVTLSRGGMQVLREKLYGLPDYNPIDVQEMRQMREILPNGYENRLSGILKDSALEYAYRKEQGENVSASDLAISKLQSDDSLFRCDKEVKEV